MPQHKSSKIHKGGEASSAASHSAWAGRSQAERGPFLDNLRARALHQFNLHDLLRPSAGGEPLPDRIRVHHEGASGVSLRDARLFRNSPVPQKWGAAALSFRNHVFVAPGQDRHTAHEAWHVVQQKRGRVPASFHMGPVGVNTDRRLEHEADRMGAQAQAPRGSEAMPTEARPRKFARQAAAGGAPGVVQGYFTHGDDLLMDVDIQKIYNYLYRGPEEHKGRREFNSRKNDFNRAYDIDNFLKNVARSDLNAAAILGRGRSGTPPASMAHSLLAQASAAPAIVSAAAASASPAPTSEVADDADEQPADAVQTASARAIIWNANHYGKPNTRNRAKLKAKVKVAEQLIAAEPDVVLFNEVNAGVSDLGDEIADDRYSFVAGPQLQALRKDKRPGQVEYYPLLFRKEKYDFLGASVATATGVTDAEDVFPWQKPKNRTSSKRKLPEHRPLVTYRLKDKTTDEEHWFGAVHTTPAGSEFKRTEVFNQVEQPLKQLRKAAGERRLFVGGDYYLTPEAVVRKGGKQTRRNQTAPPLSAQLNLTATMQSSAAAASTPAPDQHVAAPPFITNPKDADGGQIADLAVLSNWPSHRALLPNLQDASAPQNVDAPDKRFTSALFETSDHAPVIFDLSGSVDPLAAFQRVPPHAEAEAALRRTRKRSLVLKTLIRAAAAQGVQAPSGSGSDKYGDTLKRLLTALHATASEAALAAIDGDSTDIQIKTALTVAGFGSQYDAVYAEGSEFGRNAYDFESFADYGPPNEDRMGVDNDGRRHKRRRK